MLNGNNQPLKDKQPPMGAVLIVVPLLLLLLIAGGMRLLHRHSISPADGAAENAARALVGPELHRLRTAYDRANVIAAQTAAEKFARKHLALRANETVRELVVSPQKRARYRVRGVVVWQDAKNKPVSRHFEADLIHGPTDDKWRLVDTEFLP